MSAEINIVLCPVCNRQFSKQSIEEHVNKCLFLNTQQNENNCLSAKRSSSDLEINTQKEKKPKLTLKNNGPSSSKQSNVTTEISTGCTKKEDNIPLAEKLRPTNLSDLVGQTESFGPGSMLRSMLEKKKVPNMILWGPPGCGKTSLANVVASLCKEQNNLRFVKLSATMAGINDVKEVVKVAKNESQFKRQTVLFMDEIHRFNKLQQDTFLPHVENGTIVLIGATTENPSFSLNNALLSRCRVVVMKKLSVDDVMLILEKALNTKTSALIIDTDKPEDHSKNTSVPSYLVQRSSLRWLAEVCDGDARAALGALELALAARDPGPDLAAAGPATITLDDMRDGIKRSHMLYDRGGEEHYNVVSALHKAVRASDDNAALYWTARALHCGEDPLYIARRLVVAASEDIGLADPHALVEAVACLQACQQLGLPECDVVLGATAVRLARAAKSRAAYSALRRCQAALAAAPQPPVPLHLRNAPTKLMKQLGYSKGYNLLQKEHSGLTYMPEGMENVDFFRETDEGDN